MAAVDAADGKGSTGGGDPDSAQPGKGNNGSYACGDCHAEKCVRDSDYSCFPTFAAVGTNRNRGMAVAAAVVVALELDLQFGMDPNRLAGWVPEEHDLDLEYHGYG